MNEAPPESPARFLRLSDALSEALQADPRGLRGKRVLMRVDFNAPVENGEIRDFTRLDAAIDSVRFLARAGARIILMAHFERPKGRVVPEYSLKPIAAAFGARLGATVAFAGDCIGEPARMAVAGLAEGGVLLLENLRFHEGEEANDPAFVAALAALGDLYVNDAFSAAHRAHASTEGLAHVLPAFAGEAMARELDYLGRALSAPARPVLAIVGGAKISSKIEVLRHLLAKVDSLAIAGGMANTFLAAQGKAVGRSLCEPDKFDSARAILAEAQAQDCRILLPADVVAAKAFAAHAPHRICDADEVREDEMILDCGPRSVDELSAAMQDARTILWNGPLGAFEMPPFDNGTVDAARSAAGRAKAGAAIVVAGGGDTMAALLHAGVAGDFTFVSTAGGAFLEWLEGKELPGIAALVRQGSVGRDQVAH